MKKISIIFILISLLASNACKEELDVKNPNQPTPESAKTERGILNFGQGAVYVNGFYDLKYVDGVPGRFWTGAVGFHDLMGDVIAAEAANVYMNQIGAPDLVTLDNLTPVPNPQNPPVQKDMLRGVNKNAQQGQNPGFYEWAYMYSMISSINQALALVDGVAFTGNKVVKANTIKAWCYFWKGFAYSRIGSLYYAGLINDTPLSTNGNYKSKDKILAEAEVNFAKAETLLGGLAAGGDYDVVLGTLIPSICQVGKGGIVPPAAWIKNINTMRARNILVNTPVATMTPAQWTQILNLTNAGLGSTDLTFTLRSNANGDIMSSSSGNIAAKTFGSTAQGGTYKVSERLIQEFKTGDKRLAANFLQTTTWIGASDRGNSFNTRWALKNGSTDATVVSMCNRTDGAYELYLVGSYEENQLMKAEALINGAGTVDSGLAIIDGLRTLQGAGLAVTSGTGLSAALAKEELRRERRIVLAFRGFSFYDARRWGVLSTGRTGCVVIDKNGVLNTNATIKYNFLDYWDVPDNELAYNPAASGSDPIKNPN